MSPIDRVSDVDVEQAITARWVIPMDGPVLSPGVVRWKGETITSVEEGRDPHARDLGSAAILPGLINAHTHLEFSHLQRPILHRGTFASWIEGVIADRMKRTDPVGSSILRGITESQLSGTAFHGEIATSENSTSLVGSGVVFHEFLGLAEDQVDEKLCLARSYLLENSAQQSMTPGLSPHAPYSTHPQLIGGLVDLASELNAPVAMHLAESPDELELLRFGTGPLSELFQRMGIWRDGIFSRGTRPLDILHRLSQAPRALVVHGTFLDREEQQFLSEHDSLSLVYCPRTTAYFGFRPHPWREMRKHGVRVVIGTDSRASNPNLNLLEELRWLRSTTPDISTQELLKMVTCDAAEALGIQNDAGTISPGRLASLTVITIEKSGIDTESYPDLLTPPDRITTIDRGKSPALKA